VIEYFGDCLFKAAVPQAEFLADVAGRKRLTFIELEELKDRGFRSAVGLLPFSRRGSRSGYWSFLFLFSSNAFKKPKRLLVNMGNFRSIKNGLASL
jgi:hypothetical protein